MLWLTCFYGVGLGIMTKVKEAGASPSFRFEYVNHILTIFNLLLKKILILYISKIVQTKFTKDLPLKIGLLCCQFFHRYDSLGEDLFIVNSKGTRSLC